MVTVPTTFFGGNSDGALHMERWLDRMCADCVHGETVDGQAGIGCLLPAGAYVDPHADIVEWSTDAARIPDALGGLMCMSHEPRPVSAGPRRAVMPGQTSLIGGGDG